MRNQWTGFGDSQMTGLAFYKVILGCVETMDWGVRAD